MCTELLDLLAYADAAQGFFELLSGAMINAQPEAGIVSGRYEINGCIGVGGMGAVYRARDTRLQRDVALKFLPTHLGAIPSAEEHLLREARAAASLEHPNICTVYEIAATDDGRPFISMAFYEGETLKERLGHKPIPLPEALEIAKQLARGLAAAHAQGIVHRDVKPGNVMLLKDGTVKLLDFGLARLNDSSVSGRGVEAGTVAYMSPEQVRGDSVGPTSDLFTLGIVLHETITGAHPFRGGNAQAVIQAILHELPEPLRKRSPSVSPSIERMVSRLLEKHASDRYQNANELLFDLEQVAASNAPANRMTLSGTFRLGLAGALLFMIVASGTALTKTLRRPAGTTTATGAAAAPLASKTIAVLPFTNLSDDPEDEYLVDGLTEELIGALSKVGALHVVGRTSAFALSGAGRDIREIGRSLDAGAILEGSVQKVGERIRVRAHLINVADGVHVWSDTYDREVTDIFEVQRDLALRIASALRAGLTPAERDGVTQRPTTSSEAYAYYLKGRHFYNQRTRDAFVRAIDYYERAIAADPEFAAAHAGLAAVYSLQGVWQLLTPVVARERMREAALQALQLDDQLAEAHSVLGVYMHVYEWDSEAAEREQLRAIELDPRLVTARLFYGNLLRSHGRTEEALAQYRTAAELDPLDPIFSDMIGRTLLLAGRIEDARDHFDVALELDSLFWWPHAGLGLYQEASGRWTEALEEYRRADALKGLVLPDVARALARSGRKPEAQQIVDELRAEADRTGLHEPGVASALHALGDAEAALAWLERSYGERHPQLRFIAGSSRFKALEVDPRYTDLLRRIGVRP
jgi:serine/threonine-protein kinase